MNKMENPMKDTDWEKIATTFRKRLRESQDEVLYYKNILKETAFELAVCEYNFDEYRKCHE